MAFPVAVCGPRHCREEDKANAYRVGELLAQRGAVTIGGGGTGVMAAVAAGVRAPDGVVVGVRPDDRRDGASEHSFAPATGRSQTRAGTQPVWAASQV